METSTVIAVMQLYIGRDYFCRDTNGTSIFSNKEFGWRYGIPSSVYEMIRTGVLASDSYFKCNVDSVGIPGATPDQKITAALRQLPLGVSADAVVEYVRLGESTNLECMKCFVADVVDTFGDECLRPTTTEDLPAIGKRQSRLGIQDVLELSIVHRGSGPTTRLLGKDCTLCPLSKGKRRSLFVEWRLSEMM